MRVGSLEVMAVSTGTARLGRGAGTSAVCLVVRAWQVPSPSSLAGCLLGAQSCGPPALPHPWNAGAEHGGAPGRAGRVGFWTCGLVPTSGPEEPERGDCPKQPRIAGGRKKGQQVQPPAFAELGGGGLQCTSSHWSRECCGTELSVCHIEMSARATDPRGITLGKCWGSVIRCRPQSH